MIRSLNARWDWDEFHKRLVDLVEITHGDEVLDLGCGHGPTVPFILDRVGSCGRVVALDRNPKFLKKIAQQHAPEVQCGRLVIVKHDLAAGIPVSEGTFDAIICQNVLECVSDRTTLVGQAKCSLKPSGRMLFGHHDYDGVILASDNRALTRRLIHSFADSQAAWQDASEGQMGRLLPGLMIDHGFREIVTQTILYVDLELTPKSFARTYLDWLSEKAFECEVGANELQIWLSELEGRAARSAFYFAIPWIYTIVRR